jgi:7-cyano-7-deazaguanine reductase
MYHSRSLQVGKTTFGNYLFRCARRRRRISVLFNLRGGSRTRYNIKMAKSPRYTSEHASAGLDHAFPEIETWPNQFPGYEIVIDDPEFTSVCPKTGLPDFGKIEIRYMPDRLCLELKSLKEYLQSYRNLGIFQENIVNQILNDVVRWAKPLWAEVKGDFRPRGGISTVVVARWPRPKGKRK